MTLKLHAFPLSPRGFKVLLAANQLGVDYELCLVDLTKGDQRQPSFAAINPNKKMPALEDGDFSLWESNAILLYLAGKAPEAGLLPANPRRAANVMQWLFWESTTWDPGCAILAYERFVKGFFGGGGPDAMEVEKGLAKFNFAASVLDGELKGRKFICGDALTLADLAIGAALTLTEPAQLPLEPYAEIRRWGASLAELPAWKATRAMQAPAQAA